MSDDMENTRSIPTQCDWQDATGKFYPPHVYTAAPDMYEALKWIANNVGDDVSLDDMAAIANASLAKADGKC